MITFGSFMFSLCIFAFGLTLLILIAARSKNIKKECTSKAVLIGVQIMLMLSIIFTVFPICQVICNLFCKNCSTFGFNFLYILIILSAMMIAVCSTIISGLKGECKDSGLKSLCVGILITAIIIFIILILFHTDMGHLLSLGKQSYSRKQSSGRKHRSYDDQSTPCHVYESPKVCNIVDGCEYDMENRLCQDE